MLWGWGIAVILLVVVTLFVINFFKFYEGAKGSCVKTLDKNDPEYCTNNFCKKGNQPQFTCDDNMSLYESKKGKCPPYLKKGDFGYCYNDDSKQKQKVKQPITEFEEYCTDNLITEDGEEFTCDTTINRYKENNGKCPGPKNDPVKALSANMAGICHTPTWDPVENCERNYRVLGAGETIRDWICDDNHYSQQGGQCPWDYGLLDEDRCHFVGNTANVKNQQIGAQNYKTQLTYEQELANATKKKKRSGQ